MNGYYPLSRVRRQLSNDELDHMLATPTDKKGWSYLFANNDWERLRVETNNRYNITSVSFTPKYRSLWRSLKIAQTKKTKVCRYLSALAVKEN